MDDEAHQRISDLLEAYALGALEPRERAAVEAHLETCPECRRAAAELGEAAHNLPAALAAASPLAPPPKLERSLLRRIEAERSAAASDGARRARGRVRRWWRPRVALPVAALVLAAAFGVWNLQLSSALSEERSARARLAELVGHQEVVLEVVDSDKAVRRVLLPPDSVGSRAYGKVFTSSDLPQAVAMAARLRPAAEGRTYQLWLIGPGHARRAGTFDVNAEGFGLLVFRRADTDRAYEEARLTLQSPDARHPGTPVLAWRG